MLFIKKGGGQLTTHDISYSQRKINYIRSLFDKSIRYCIVLVHDLTNDISYDAKLNGSKICYLRVKYQKKNKIMCKNR